ncbi:hypothetical protein MTO96_029479 [Rhipicephalus appendiculatus]
MAPEGERAIRCYSGGASGPRGHFRLTFICFPLIQGNILPCSSMMEVDSPARPPDSPASESAASRKRNCVSSNSEATIIDTAENADSCDDEYETVMSQKAKRRMM